MRQMSRPISSGGDNNMTLSLQEISDRIEIEELLVRYCYAVDDRDWDAYRNLFTTDAVLDDGEGKRQVFFQGLWYRDRVMRTPEGWRISELVEEGYWNHNVPEGFAF